MQCTRSVGAYLALWVCQTTKGARGDVDGHGRRVAHDGGAEVDVLHVDLRTPSDTTRTHCTMRHGAEETVQVSCVSTRCGLSNTIPVLNKCFL